jgi:hypothetical protein
MGRGLRDRILNPVARRHVGPQATLMMQASPWARPPQIHPSTYPPPSLRSFYMRFMMIRAPLAVVGCPMAMALPFTLVFARIVSAFLGSRSANRSVETSGTTAKTSLISITLISSQREIGTLKGFSSGNGRSLQHSLRPQRNRGHGNNVRQRLEPQLFSPAQRHEQNGRGPVVQTGSVSGFDKGFARGYRSIDVLAHRRVTRSPVHFVDPGAWDPASSEDLPQRHGSQLKKIHFPKRSAKSPERGLAASTMTMSLYRSRRPGIVRAAERDYNLLRQETISEHTSLVPDEVRWWCPVLKQALPPEGSARSAVTASKLLSSAHR